MRPGVAALLVDLAPRADGAVDAEQVGQGQHDLLGRRGDQVDAVAGRPVQLHELERLGVHDRLHRLEHRLADDLAHLGPVPALGHGQHRLADADQPLLVGPEVEVDQLGDGGPGHQAPVDEPALEERPPERGDGGAVDDRLVEIEEGRLHISNGTGDRAPALSTRDNWRTRPRTFGARELGRRRGCGLVALTRCCVRDEQRVHGVLGVRGRRARAPRRRTAASCRPGGRSGGRPGPPPPRRRRGGRPGRRWRCRWPASPRPG